MACQLLQLRARPGLAGQPSRGFTLIELMVGIVVVGILAAVALPAYQQYMYRSRRADATAALGSLQQAQERYRANEQNYAGALTALGITSDISPQGHYTIAITAAAATGYTLTATARSSSPQSRDADCGRFQLQMSTGNSIYTALKSDLSTPNNSCWPK